MNIVNLIKKNIKQTKYIGTLYQRLHSLSVENKYLRIRECLHDKSISKSRGVINRYCYDNNRLLNSTLHTLAVYCENDWERHSFPQALAKIGKYQEIVFKEYPRDVNTRSIVSRNICEKIREVYKNECFDWIFFYVNGWMMLKEDIRTLRQELQVPIVLLALDDKHNFYEKKLGDQYTGTVDLCTEFDVYWTSSRLAAEWVKTVGGNPFYLPEGANPDMFYYKKMDKDIDVSFIGQKYGIRPKFIEALRTYGLNVQCFGSGWSDRSYIPTEKMREIYSRSKINLGLGYGSSTDLFTNVKGRDFEIPITGGGLYVTTYNPDLALHYNIGKEIVCYRTLEEAVELIRYYLEHSIEAESIARAGRRCAIQEHTWESRFRAILQHLKILSA